MGLLTAPLKVHSGSAWGCRRARSGSGMRARGIDALAISLACLTYLALDCVSGSVSQPASATSHKATATTFHARVQLDGRRPTSPDMTPLRYTCPLCQSLGTSGQGDFAMMILSR